MSATAAKGAFPYTKHRTVAQVWSADTHIRSRVAFAELDQLSRERGLTLLESRRLERLIKKIAA